MYTKLKRVHKEHLFRRGHFTKIVRQLQILQIVQPQTEMWKPSTTWKAPNLSRNTRREETPPNTHSSFEGLSPTAGSQINWPRQSRRISKGVTWISNMGCDLLDGCYSSLGWWDSNSSRRSSLVPALSLVPQSKGTWQYCGTPRAPPKGRASRWGPLPKERSAATNPLLPKRLRFNRDRRLQFAQKSRGAAGTSREKHGGGLLLNAHIFKFCGSKLSPCDC